MSARDIADAFDDLPDAAFFGVMEEFGIDPMDLVEAPRKKRTKRTHPIARGTKAVPHEVSRAGDEREETSSPRDVTHELTFPRADESPRAGYRAEYRHDCRALMLAWVGRKLVSFEDLFELGPTTFRDALLCAHEQATAELNRAVNANEALLIAECVRDLLVARIAERKRERDTEQARQAELSREVL